MEGVEITSNARVLARELSTGKFRPLIHTGIPERVANSVDILYKTAQKRFRSFLETYGTIDKDQNQALGWSKVREYKAPGTVFLFATDTIAPDSIVVETAIKKGGEEEDSVDTNYYWISPDRDHRWGLPFVYLLIEDQSTHEFKPYLLGTFLAPNQKSVSSVIEDSFSTTTPGFEEIRFEYEIWKQGKVNPAKKPVEKSRHLSSLVPNRVPIGSKF